MQKVVGTTITLTRGDTFKATVKMLRKKTREEYRPEAEDVISFAMNRTYGSGEPLIEKTIDNETLLLQLDPSDTSSLPIGDYVYDIEITFANGDVDTFIANGKIRLTEEVPR